MKIRSQNEEYAFILLQRISYSKKDSDVIAKMKGTFVERPKKKRHDDEEKSEKKKKKARGDRYVLVFYFYQAYQVRNNHSFEDLQCSGS